jgi:hypothetical protein
MLSSYRALLGRAGARRLVVACAVSWLSYGGYELAVVLTVQNTTRSFALAGVAVAVSHWERGLWLLFADDSSTAGIHERCATSPPPTCWQPPCCSPAALQAVVRCCLRCRHTAWTLMTERRFERRRHPPQRA